MRYAHSLTPSKCDTIRPLAGNCAGVHPYEYDYKWYHDWQFE